MGPDPHLGSNVIGRDVPTPVSPIRRCTGDPVHETLHGVYALKRRTAEFYQAVREVLAIIGPVEARRPEYVRQNLVERISIPSARSSPPPPG